MNDITVGLLLITIMAMTSSAVHASWRKKHNRVVDHLNQQIDDLKAEIERLRRGVM